MAERGATRRELTRIECDALFRRLREIDPQPRTELEYATPFQLLVAVILSAQATDAGVNRVTRRLFAVAPTPAAMLELGDQGLRESIASIGLSNAKARHIIGTCARLIELHDGAVPADRAALEALPGVGRKTANVMLNTAFGEPTIAVDTHVFRVANRTGLARGSTTDAVERKLLRRVPPEFRLHAHHWLLLHGRYMCLARRPDCAHCAVRDLCLYPFKTAAPVTRSSFARNIPPTVTST